MISRSKRFLASLVVFAGLAFSATAQDRIALDLDSGRRLAQEALLSGNPELTRELALGLLQANPDDRTAWVLLAAALPQLGDAAGGQKAGARAYALSTTETEKYEAARLTALAAMRAERFTQSQIWLRRAAIHAPNDAQARQTARDYRLVADRNPLRIDLAFAATPSSNLNGGSESAYSIIDGLPFIGVLSGDAQALSGIEARGDVALRYRLSSSETRQQNLTARMIGRAVRLSDAARETAPEAENGDFAYLVADLGYGDRRVTDALGYGWGVNFGRVWGGAEAEVSYSFAKLSADGTYTLSDRAAAQVFSSMEMRWDGDGARDARIGTIGGGLTWVADGAMPGQYAASLSLRHTESPTPNDRSDVATAQLSFAPAQAIGPASMRFTLGGAMSDYPDYAVVFVVPGGRQDTMGFASVEVTPADWSYAGFAPVLTLTRQITRSNVSRFDTAETSLQIGIRSTF
ncbi:hypothetical protein EU803_02625 [Loktanella sp. IMCC34160]|uniref:hypothetical protein n=1 Tax=Loktanella sp. IMCC34160 TaxID=2510646 RepID=UPI00101DAD3A|nr:hypothetical protein [Loktanella sp. IMCC34160]RYG93021.1 hypothetical protein EU803_02625 [Loktanella sp. IMCC34160]